MVKRCPAVMSPRLHRDAGPDARDERGEGHAPREAPVRQAFRGPHCTRTFSACQPPGLGLRRYRNVRYGAAGWITLIGKCERRSAWRRVALAPANARKRCSTARSICSWRRRRADHDGGGAAGELLQGDALQMVRRPRGLLTATVQWQAAKVRGRRSTRSGSMPRHCGRASSSSRRTADGDLRAHVGGAQPAGDRSRRRRHSDLGAIVLENGRLAMGKRLKPVLEAGRDARLLLLRQFGERRSARSSGWLARDVQIRLLLGDKLTLTKAEIERDASGRRSSS